jgi:hypothetical protein
MPATSMDMREPKIMLIVFPIWDKKDTNKIQRALIIYRKVVTDLLEAQDSSLSDR